MLPHRTIIYVLLRYVVQKQNHALELDISGRLHEREVGLARRKEKLVGPDSFSKDTEMGTWQACVNLIHIKAACPELQAECLYWYFHHSFKWYINWVFNNVETFYETYFLFNSPLIHLIMSGRKTHICANVF